MVVWISQQTTPDLVQFAQFGVLGLLVVAFMVGWVWPKPAVERLIKDKERMVLELERRDRVTSEVVIPVLVSSKELILRLESRMANGASK